MSCHAACRAGFVPLDAAWPATRVVQVAQQAGLALVIDTSCNPISMLSAAQALGCSAGHGQQLPQAPAQALLDSEAATFGTGMQPTRSEQPPAPTCLAQLQASGIHVTTLTELEGEPGAATGTQVAAAAERPLPWCYVLFTSGSTGQPQGVLGTEQGILNRCAWMQRQGLVAQVGAAPRKS